MNISKAEKKEEQMSDSDLIKRNKMPTHLRIAANLFVGIMLGAIFVNVGSEASRTRMHENFTCCYDMLNHFMCIALCYSRRIPNFAEFQVSVLRLIRCSFGSN